MIEMAARRWQGCLNAGSEPPRRPSTGEGLRPTAGSFAVVFALIVGDSAGVTTDSLGCADFAGDSGN